MPPGAVTLILMPLLSSTLLRSAFTVADISGVEQVQVKAQQSQQLHPAALTVCPDGSTMTACGCEADLCLHCPHCTPAVQQQQQQTQHQQYQVQQTKQAAAAHQSVIQMTASALSEQLEHQQQQQQTIATPASQSADDAGHAAVHAAFAQPNTAQQQQQQDVLHVQQTQTPPAVATSVSEQALPDNVSTAVVHFAGEQQQEQQQQQHVPLHNDSVMPAGSGQQTINKLPLLSSMATFLAAASEQQPPDVMQQPHIGMEKTAAAAADASGIEFKLPVSATQAGAVQPQEQQQQYMLSATGAVQPSSTAQHLAPPSVHALPAAAAAAAQQQQQQLPPQTPQITTVASFDQLPQADADVYLLNTARPPISQPVGSRFSFRVEVGVLGLPGASATNIVLESQLPDGLLIARYGVDETFMPYEGACAVVTASSYRCDWPLLHASEVRVIEVTVIARQAGSYSITAAVRTTSTDNTPQNNESTAQIEALGACCDRQTSIPKCQDVLSSTDCPPGSTFFTNQSCQRIRCEENSAGACCVKWGSCVDRTYPSACQAANGTWHADSTCSALRKQSLCKPATGACCNVRDGRCFENVAVSECDLKSSTWWLGGNCASDGYCSGACCDVLRRLCYQSKKSDCQAPTQSWSLYGQCDPSKCQMGDGCAAAWYKCKPGDARGTDKCCPGLECAEAPSGSRVGKYVCQPKFTLTCGTEGMSCGGKSSAMCCEGYVCWWDQSSNKGHCWPQPEPNTCVQDGSKCHHDRDCCYGSRCYFRHRRTGPSSHGGKPSWAQLQPAAGQCVPVSLEKCHKDCFDYNCYVERQRDCNALYATAAARSSCSS